MAPTMLKIERGLATPAPVRRQTKWADTFRQMQPGDSFYFEGVKPVTVVTLYGTTLARGRYTIRREGMGYRFFVK